MCEDQRYTTRKKPNDSLRVVTYWLDIYPGRSWQEKSYLYTFLQRKKCCPGIDKARSIDNSILHRNRSWYLATSRTENLWTLCHCQCNMAHSRLQRTSQRCKRTSGQQTESNLGQNWGRLMASPLHGNPIYNLRWKGNLGGRIY